MKRNLNKENFNRGVLIRIPKNFIITDFINDKELLNVYDNIFRVNCVYGVDSETKGTDEYDREIVHKLIDLFKKINLVIYEFYPGDEDIIIYVDELFSYKMSKIDTGWTRIKE